MDLVYMYIKKPLPPDDEGIWTFETHWVLVGAKFMWKEGTKTCLILYWSVGPNLMLPVGNWSPSQCMDRLYTCK